ncbi:hypothetical protein HYH02_012094 [Chlamydomonas schloesseri]|uniref:Uncharacterized protein n=1 Tax=Chlamydomonas schloesseri TaxID=2026947 RepID=A0A835T9K4_9CHLO|nr:hypothetical protein HYH02_012094 [Chlamydomonas schloesseri]|eukprot:KAG2434895.1 hypothetical protein HYH02_012094 [Chlamydomonas schloesseri]
MATSPQLAKTAEALMAAALGEASQQSTAAASDTVAELRHIHGIAAKLLAELSAMRQEALHEGRIARLQRGYATLLANQARYSQYFDVMEYIISKMLERIDSRIAWPPKAGWHAKMLLGELGNLTGLQFSVDVDKERLVTLPKVVCAANRGGQPKNAAQQSASLYKKAEELMQVAVSEAAQQSATTSKAAVAERRHIHSSTDRLLAELSSLREDAHKQRLQTARVILGPILESSYQSYGYTRFNYPRLLDYALATQLYWGAQRDVHCLSNGDSGELNNFNAETFRFELEGLTGLSCDVYLENGEWHFELY